MIEEKYQFVAHMTENMVEAVKRTGLKVMNLKERYVKLKMPLEGNMNHAQMMYAGSLFCIGEIVGGVIIPASMDRQDCYPLAKSVTIDFLKPATSDVTLELSMSKEEVNRLEKELEELGKSDYKLSIELKDNNEEIVSLIHGTWQVRKLPEHLKEIYNS